VEKAKFIWFNGEFIPWDRAQVHILTHTLHYGLGVFEGIRCYNTPRGPAVFRNQEHIERLFNSAHIMKMEVPFSHEEIRKAIFETIKINDLKEHKAHYLLRCGSHGIESPGQPRGSGHNLLVLGGIPGRGRIEEGNKMQDFVIHQASCEHRHDQGQSVR